MKPFHFPCVASILFLALVPAVGCAPRTDFIPPDDPLVGKPAMHFVFHNVHGRAFATENLSGRTVVLIFLRAGQPALQELLREMEKMQRDPALSRVEFVALLPEPDPLTAPFWIGLRNSLKFGLDFTGAAKRYGAGQLPLVVVWDFQGIVRLRVEGFLGKNFQPRLEATRKLVEELERQRTDPDSPQS